MSRAGARGEGKRRSAWGRATKLASPPTTHIDAVLRALCMQGEKAISIVSGRDRGCTAHFGTPAEPEVYVAWRVDAISLYLRGELPEAVALTLGDAADVRVEVTWPVNG